MSFKTTTVASVDSGRGIFTSKGSQVIVPQIVVSPPTVEDIPCITNKSPRRAPKFVEDGRRKKYAISMPPLKGMPQPISPVVVNVRVSVYLGSQAAIVDEPAAHERYAFPAASDEQVIIPKNADGTSDLRSDDTHGHSGPLSPRPGFPTPQFLSSTTAGVPNTAVRGRPRRRSGIMALQLK